MFGETRYIRWALRHFGTVAYDLGTSGIPLVEGDALAPIAAEGAAKAGDIAQYDAARAAVAAYHARSADEVVVTLGTTQALFCAYASLVVPGDDVLVEAPGYEPLTRTAEGLGARVRTYPRRAELGYRIDPADVAAQMTPRTRAVVVSTLHNPTGVRTDDATLRELAAIADAQGATLLVDEVYAPFDSLATGGVFAGSARRLAENVVAVGSLTKCYGLGMMRAGWLLGPEGIVARANDALVATVGHLPLAHAAFVAAAFRRIDALSRRAAVDLAEKRALATAWAARLGLGWSAPEDGLFGLVTVPGAGDLLGQIEAHAKAEGVLVSAGTFFGVPDGFRLSWASCAPARFAEGLARLEKMPAISAAASRRR